MESNRRNTTKLMKIETFKVFSTFYEERTFWEKNCFFLIPDFEHSKSRKKNADFFPKEFISPEINSDSIVYKISTLNNHTHTCWP